MTYSQFGKNFRAIREDAGITQYEAAEKLDVTQTTISAWETRGGKPRSRQIEERILEAFNVSEQDIYGFSDGYYARKNGLSGNTALAGSTFTASAPVLGRIAAGDPNAAIEMTDETHDLPAKVRDRFPDGFFLVVRGDSMDKVLPDGCYAYIAPPEDIDIRDGDIAAVKVNGDEATVKHIKMFDGVIILEPDSTNPAHKRRVIDENDPDAPYVRVLGRVVWYDYEFVKF